MKLSTKIFILSTFSGLIFNSVLWAFYLKIEALIPKTEQRTYIIALSIISAFVLFVAWAISYYIKRKVVKIESVLKEITSKTITFEEKTNSVTKSGTQLSDTVSEQASSLQETVASVTQISSMVTQNSDFSKTSSEFSHQSEQKAREGRETVAKMIEAIDDIASTNNEMAEKITVSNKEFYQIIDVIKQIGEQTKVINDIVFQTKLLSFNASVEAARAGIHGKGFAVVAEEVGKLAQMSGNSATEISDMLDSSIEKVENIVNRAQDSLEVLIKTGKDKVQLGTEVAKKCDEALDQILEGATKVTSMMSEIANASNEQATGLTEISKAIHQLDQSTLKNSELSREFSSTSMSMSVDAKEIKASLFGLLHLLESDRNQQLPKPKAKLATTTKTEVKKVHHISEAKKVAPKPAQKQNEKVIKFPTKETVTEKKSEPQKTFKGTNADNIPASSDPRFVDF